MHYEYKVHGICEQTYAEHQNCFTQQINILANDDWGARCWMRQQKKTNKKQNAQLLYWKARGDSFF